MATDPEKKDASESLALPSSKPELHDSVHVTQGTITDELVLGKDGFALFPQPVLSDDLDPLNWSSVQKHTILAIVMALYVLSLPLLPPFHPKHQRGKRARQEKRKRKTTKHGRNSRLIQNLF